MRKNELCCINFEFPLQLNLRHIQILGVTTRNLLPNLSTLFLGTSHLDSHYHNVYLCLHGWAGNWVIPSIAVLHRFDSIVESAPISSPAISDRLRTQSDYYPPLQELSAIRT